MQIAEAEIQYHVYTARSLQTNKRTAPTILNFPWSSTREVESGKEINYCILKHVSLPGNDQTHDWLGGTLHPFQLQDATFQQ